MFLRVSEVDTQPVEQHPIFQELPPYLSIFSWSEQTMWFTFYPSKENVEFGFKVVLFGAVKILTLVSYPTT